MDSSSCRECGQPTAQRHRFVSISAVVLRYKPPLNCLRYCSPSPRRPPLSIFSLPVLLCRYLPRTDVMSRRHRPSSDSSIQSHVDPTAAFATMLARNQVIFFPFEFLSMQFCTFNRWWYCARVTCSLTIDVCR